MMDSLNTGKVHVDLWLLVIVALIGAFYALTLRAGHTWGDDFAQYILHAKNIAEGRSYSDLPFIRNPFNFISPEAYPPLVPVVLAPVYYLFGFDLVALKLVMVAGLCGALLVIGKSFSRDLPAYLVLILLVLFALNPVVWSMKDKIQSEYYYILCSFLTLLVIDRYGVGADSRQQLAGGVFIGVTMYLAYATREIGFILLPALLVFELLVFRKITLRPVIAVALFALLVAVQGEIIESAGMRSMRDYPQLIELVERRGISTSSGHTSLVHLSLAHIGRQAVKYAEAIKDFWSPDHILGWLMFIGTGLFAIAGFTRRLLNRISVYEVYAAGYIIVLLLFGGKGGLRYLIPIIPLYLFYAFNGLQWFGSLAGRRLSTIVLAGLLVCTAVIYAHEYRKQDFEHIANGISMPGVAGLVQYIKTSTAQDAVIVFRKPRALALLTGRTASVYPHDYHPYVMHGYLDAIGADYVVKGRFTLDVDLLEPMIENRPAAFEPVYSNASFDVYRYHAPAGVDLGTERIKK